MQVILKETLSNLGEAGSIVNVKDGYARNYLIPKDLAAPATPGMHRQLEHIRRLAEKRRAQEIKTAEDLKNRLESLSLSIRAKAGENDRLFGSVTNSDIAKLLAREGIEIDRRKIVLDQPIRVLGEHTVHIKIDPQVGADVRLTVEPSEEKPKGRRQETAEETTASAGSPEKTEEESAAESEEAQAEAPGKPVESREQTSEESGRDEENVSSGE